MSLPIDAICCSTASPLSTTPGSAEDSARTRATLSFGWRSIALQARCRTSAICSAAVSPRGGDCATRPFRRVGHSVIAAASRWSLEEK
jgi:hypothetical protein